ncbi:LanC-like protein 2 [Manis javanica]|nr:LanC-like protein 2 [Manis javanica]
MLFFWDGGIIPGIALLYLQLYRVTCDQTYLLRSLDYVKRTLRNLNGRKVTFLCGDAGPLAVGAVVYHKLKSDCESQECISKLLQLQRTIVCQDSELPDELLYGRAGYLYALLYLNTEIGPGTVCESAVKEVVNAVIESGKALSREERKAERCPLLYQWHRKQYVGAAHGMTGIYYMLLQISYNSQKY